MAENIPSARPKGSKPKPNAAQRAALKRAIDAEKKRRRQAEKNRRTPGSNIPSPRRSRKDIMKELT